MEKMCVDERKKDAAHWSLHFLGRHFCSQFIIIVQKDPERQAVRHRSKKEMTSDLGPVIWCISLIAFDVFFSSIIRNGMKMLPYRLQESDFLLKSWKRKNWNTNPDENWNDRGKNNFNLLAQSLNYTFKKAQFLFFLN